MPRQGGGKSKGRPKARAPAKQKKLITESAVPASGAELEFQRLALMEQRLELKRGLPHLYGFKFYKWAQEFFDTTNPIALLCSANQISKSSTQIRKMINWATNEKLWPKLWRTRPKQFWYLYPTKDVVHIEFTKKWVPEFLPRGEYREHELYGWEPEFFHKRIWALHFNSDVSIYFKTYGQDVQDLQTGTVHYIALDEEPQEAIMDELFMRLAAVDGHLSAVFTPTIGQDYWREAVEEEGEEERFPGAFKRQVSMYDCLTYADGSATPWTPEKITRIINTCKSPQDVQRRVFGRFVVSGGLKYPGFYRPKNVGLGHYLPKNWLYYCGVDIGSGGKNHPGAVTVVGVSPDMKKGRIFRHWRGDGIETTAGDIVERAMAMTMDLSGCQIYYDSACRDFYLLAVAKGLPVIPAEKGHTFGEHIVNVLFKNSILMGYDYPELKPLWNELSTLKVSTPKRSAKDDSIDSLRYAVSSVPWDFSGVVSDEVVDEVGGTNNQKKKQGRREYWEGDRNDKDLHSIDAELEAYNELMGVEDGF